jgi:hypothetical protein
MRPTIIVSSTIKKAQVLSLEWHMKTHDQIYMQNSPLV